MVGLNTGNTSTNITSVDECDDTSLFLLISKKIVLECLLNVENKSVTFTIDNKKYREVVIKFRKDQIRSICGCVYMWGYKGDSIKILS